MGTVSGNLLACLVIVGCGAREIRFVNDRQPVAQTITLTEQRHSPSGEGGIVIVGATVVDAKEVFGLDLTMLFDKTAFNVANVYLGSLFPEAPFLTAPAQPDGLLHWNVSAVDDETFALAIQVDQDAVAGVALAGRGAATLIDVMFYAAEPDIDARTPVTAVPGSRVFRRDGTTLYDDATFRGGELVLQ